MISEGELTEGVAVPPIADKRDMNTTPPTEIVDQIELAEGENDMEGALVLKVPTNEEELKPSKAFISLIGSLQERDENDELLPPPIQLDLSYERVSVADFTRFCEILRTRPGVFVIELARMSLDERYLPPLVSMLEKNRLVQVLDLSGNPIGDAGIALLSPVLSCLPLLQRLSLHHCAIGEVGARDLARIAGNQAIQVLQLHGNPCLSATTSITELSRAVNKRSDLDCDHFVAPHDREGAVLEKIEKKWAGTNSRARAKKLTPEQLSFFELVLAGKPKALLKFLKLNGKVVDVQSDHPDGFNANHIAAANGSVAMLKELIKLGVPVQSKTQLSLSGHPSWFVSGSGKFGRSLKNCK